MQGTEEHGVAFEGDGELKDLTETPLFKEKKKEDWRKTWQT